MRNLKNADTKSADDNRFERGFVYGFAGDGDETRKDFEESDG